MNSPWSNARTLSSFALCLLPLNQQTMILCQSLDAPVVGGFAFFGEKAAGHTFVVVAVMGYAFTAFSVSRAVVGAGARKCVIAGHKNSFLVWWI